MTNEVRLSDTSIVALSGSNAVRKILQFVDDFDFFEYVSDEPAEIIERLTKRLLTEGTSVCERAKIGTTEFNPPYNLDAAKEAVCKLDPINDNDATIKLDYLTSLAGDRPFEVTNISGFVDKNLDGLVKERTFPFQEIVLSSKDSAPSKLDDPVEVGRYICWLISEVEIHAESGMMLKAIKRALSLCRFCWFDDLLNEIHALFDNTVTIHEAEIQTTKALIERVKSNEIILSGIELEDLDWKLKELVADAVSKKVKQDRHFPKGFDLEAFEIIRKMRDRVSCLSKGSLIDA